MSRRLPLSNPDYVPFYQFIDENAFQLQKCSNCARIRFPVAPLCYVCASPAFDWAKMSGRGHVTSWVVFRRQYFDDIPAPYIVVQVELDEGPRLTANLLGLPPEHVTVGLPVTAVYETIADGRALLQFAPDPVLVSRPATQPLVQQ